MGKEKKGVPGLGVGVGVLGSGRSKSNRKTSQARGGFPKALLPTSKGLVLKLR